MLRLKMPDLFYTDTLASDFADGAYISPQSSPTCLILRKGKILSRRRHVRIFILYQLTTVFMSYKNCVL